MWVGWWRKYCTRELLPQNIHKYFISLSAVILSLTLSPYWSDFLILLLLPTPHITKWLIGFLCWKSCSIVRIHSHSHFELSHILWHFKSSPFLLNCVFICAFRCCCWCFCVSSDKCCIIKHFQINSIHEFIVLIRDEFLWLTKKMQFKRGLLVSFKI